MNEQKGGSWLNFGIFWIFERKFKIDIDMEKTIYINFFWFLNEK